MAIGLRLVSLSEYRKFGSQTTFGPIVPSPYRYRPKGPVPSSSEAENDERPVTFVL